jgi:hypothetical protein
MEKIRRIIMRDSNNKIINNSCAQCVVKGLCKYEEEHQKFIHSLKDQSFPKNVYVLINCHFFVKNLTVYGKHNVVEKEYSEEERDYWKKYYEQRGIIFEPFKGE